MLRSLMILSTVLALGLPVVSHAEAAKKSAAPEAAMSTDVTTVTSKVVEVNHSKQTLTLEGADGVPTEIKVDGKVKNFKNIKKGDMVVVQEIQSLALNLIKAKKGEKPSAQTTTTTSTAPVGSKPGMESVETTQIVAEVVGVDLAKSMVELKGPQGNVLKLKAKDPKNLEGVKKGDMVNATYTTALAISVEASK